MFLDPDENNNARQKFIRQVHMFSNQSRNSQAGTLFATNPRVVLDSVERTAATDPDLGVTAPETRSVV